MTDLRSNWLLRWCAGAFAAALILAAAACGSGDDKNGGVPTVNDNPTDIPGLTPTAKFPLSVQRSDGKELKVEKPVTKIVSLSPGATEILYALGADSRLAAVDNNADYPEAAKTFATRVDAYQPNVETIAALQPDLVIVASDTNGIVGALDRLNIPVLFIDLDKDVKSIDDVLGQIGLLGRMTETDDTATQMITDLTARVKAVEEKLVGLPNTKGPTVYHELDNTFYSASEQTFIGSLYRTLKARNIAKDGGGTAYPQLTQEAIIAANPEIIVLADEAFGTSIASVKARPGWSAIKAVQDNKIFAIDPNIISRPGPRIVDALEELARDFYPQAFGDESPAGGPTSAPTAAPTPVGTR